MSCVEAVWDVGEGRIRGGKTSVYDVWGEARKRDGASGIIKYWVVPPEMRCSSKRAGSQPASQRAASPWNKTPKAHRDPLTTNPPDLRVSPRVPFHYQVYCSVRYI